MRAETQANIEAIEKTLKLLAQRMDWETAPHRLEEFDAMIEAPDLWNDPAKARNSTACMSRLSYIAAVIHFAPGCMPQPTWLMP